MRRKGSKEKEKVERGARGERVRDERRLEKDV